MTARFYNCGRRDLWTTTKTTISCDAPATITIDDDGRPERVRRGFTVFQGVLILLAGINLGVWFTVGWYWLRTPTQAVAPASEPVTPRLAPQNHKTPHDSIEGERWEM